MAATSLPHSTKQTFRKTDPVSSMLRIKRSENRVVTSLLRCCGYFPQEGHGAAAEAMMATDSSMQR